MFNPRFLYNHSIVKNLMSIERLKEIVNMLPLPSDVERKLREDAKMKMAHYSTRIEGNPLNLAEASQAILTRKDRQGIKAEQEVRNYWEALSFLATSKKMKVVISEEFIKRLHSIIEVRGSGRRNRQSEYRGPTPPGVLFAVYDNLTGKPEYIPPESKDVPALMRDFVKWINSEEANQLPIPIKAAIATYQLLTIHPFEDGNGRTSRALATYILSLGGYDLKGFNSMEEYYIADLQGYYKNIQMNLPPLYYEGRDNPDNLAPWIEYIINIMEQAFNRVANLAKSQYHQHSDPVIKSLEPKEKKLLRLLLSGTGTISPKEIAAEFNVHTRTVTMWAVEWIDKGIIEPASGEKRIRSYKIGKKYLDVTLEQLGYLDN